VVCSGIGTCAIRLVSFLGLILESEREQSCRSRCRSRGEVKGIKKKKGRVWPYWYVRM